MNMWVSSAPFNPSTGPTNAIAVRKRLMSLAVRERQPMAICVEEPALIRAITIEPNVTRHDHDAHIRAWHAYLFDMANPCKAHIRMLSYHRHAARLGDPESAARIERKRAESRRGHDARRVKAA